MKVQEAAQSLEQGCREGIDNIGELLKTVEIELAPVLEGLASLGAVQPDDSRGGRSKSLNMAEVEPLLRELHRNIAENNFNTIDTVAQLAILLDTPDYQGHLDKLSKAIDSYSFDQAMDELMAIAEQLNVEILDIDI